ncbi:MAG: copper-binding protein [Betaproteobacteria bacterium]
MKGRVSVAAQKVPGNKEGGLAAAQKSTEQGTTIGAKVETAAATGDMTDGEVRKVDKDAKKITIKHGPIQNLDMPAMTMVFQVKDLMLLDKVKAGDKVKFEAQKLGGAFTVTKIEAAK